MAASGDRSSTALAFSPSGFGGQPQLYADHRGARPDGAARAERHARAEPAERRQRRSIHSSTMAARCRRASSICSVVRAAVWRPALSQLSGEAATGSQQSAFQLMDQFLGFMTDPLAGGPSGGSATTGAAPMSFAAEARDAAARRGARLCQRPQGAAAQLRAALERAWRSLRGLQSQRRRRAGSAPTTFPRAPAASRARSTIM